MTNQYDSASKGSMMNRCILIVDDDQEIRLVLQALLEEDLYTVETASDGAYAWDRLMHHSGRYQAILLDLHMPRLNGFQLIRAPQAQSQEALASVSVLSADEEAIHQARGMGIEHALKKPFDLEDVLALISRAPVPAR